MSSSNLSFHISMEKESFGKILYASENAGKVLGWRKNEFFSKTLEMMLPRFLRNETMKILRGGDHNSLNGPRFNKVIDCFLVNSQNWVIPCHGFYCLYPRIKEGLKIVVLLRMKTHHEEMIIVNYKGVIQGATQRIGQLLGLQGVICLEEICPIDHKSLFDDAKGIKLSFHSKGDRNKIILNECCVSVEEYSLKEKYLLIKFLSEDVLKVEKQNKPEINKLLQLQLQQIKEYDQEQDEIPSERVNSPVGSARYFLTPRLKSIENFIIAAGDNLITEDLLIATKYPSETFAPKVLQRNQSRRSEEYLQESSIVSSQTSSQRIELEQALHITPKDNSMRAVNGLFRLYFFIAVLLLIIFKVLHTDSTNTVINNTTISTAALLRLLRICNVFGQAGALVRADEGTALPNRYAFVGIPNFKLSAVNGMSAIVKNLLDSNNQLRQYVSKIEEKFYKNLYTELPMYFYNSSGTVIGNQTTNPFELVSQLVARADKVMRTSFALIKGFSPDVMFIYKNSVNRLLVLSEEGLSVIADDTDAKLNNLLHLTICFFAVMVVIGLAFFCFFLYVVNRVVQDQEKTFEFFRRLDEEEIVNYMKTVELFCSIMQHSGMNLQLAAKKLQQNQGCFSEMPGPKPTTLRKGKLLHKKGVYNTLIQIVFIVSALLLVVFSGYIIILALVKSQNNTISTKVNLIISFNYQAYENSLLKFSQPEYLGGQLNMTLRSQPFMQEWERTYERNLQMGDSFLQIIDPEKGFGEDEMLVELVTGDLCKLIVTDITIALTARVGDLCDKVLGGLARKGVKAAYDYGMYWMHLSLMNFEASGRTKADSIKALNETVQRQFEMIGILYVRSAMEKISNRMEAQLQKDADKGIHLILVVVIMYVVIYVTVVLVVWHKIQKVFSAQKIKWRRLFILVPESIILSNRALTGYLLNGRNRSLKR